MMFMSRVRSSWAKLWGIWIPHMFWPSWRGWLSPQVLLPPHHLFFSSCSFPLSWIVIRASLILGKRGSSWFSGMHLLQYLNSKYVASWCPGFEDNLEGIWVCETELYLKYIKEYITNLEQAHYRWILDRDIFPDNPFLQMLCCPHSSGRVPGWNHILLTCSWMKSHPHRFFCN